ncbi:MAG: 30S ribosomal protein THX [Flavobacteriales bacterium]|nr:30S ribosomal protein THX [Flavobacteriales bacterium]MCX7768236.1 30S ribosomal protein THX [Flavobacteriales bacterium]
MGKGDRRTEKGKRWNGSYGNARPRRKKKKKTVPRATA